MPLCPSLSVHNFPKSLLHLKLAKHKMAAEMEINPRIIAHESMIVSGRFLLYIFFIVSL